MTDAALRALCAKHAKGDAALAEFLYQFAQDFPRAEVGIGLTDRYGYLPMAPDDGDPEDGSHP